MAEPVVVTVDAGLRVGDWQPASPALVQAYESLLAASEALAGVGLYDSDQDTIRAMRFTIAIAEQFLQDAKELLERLEEEEGRDAVR